MWVIVYGDLGEGIQGAVGPFNSEDEAEEYAETHGLEHFENFICELDQIQSPHPLWQAGSGG